MNLSVLILVSFLLPVVDCRNGGVRHKIGIIIGTTLFGVLLLLVFLAIIYFLCMRKPSKPRWNQNEKSNIANPLLLEEKPIPFRGREYQNEKTLVSVFEETHRQTARPEPEAGAAPSVVSQSTNRSDRPLVPEQNTQAPTNYPLRDYQSRFEPISNSRMESDQPQMTATDPSQEKGYPYSSGKGYPYGGRLGEIQEAEMMQPEPYQIESPSRDAHLMQTQHPKTMGDTQAEMLREKMAKRNQERNLNAARIQQTTTVTTHRQSAKAGTGTTAFASYNINESPV